MGANNPHILFKTFIHSLKIMKLKDILNRLRTQDFSSYYQSKPGKNGGKYISYIPWYRLPDILDSSCGDDGYWSLKNDIALHDALVIVNCTITITDIDGNSISRSAIGNELIEVINFVNNDGVAIKKQKEIPYGDPTSNASAQAFRRAMALFGVGTELWERDRSDSGILSKNEWEKRFKQ